MMSPNTLEIPGELPVMVLPEAILFPHSLLPLHIFEEKYRRMLDWSLRHSRVFGIARPLPFPDLLRDPSDLASVMSIGLVRACVEKPDGTSDLILHGLRRVEITGVVQEEPFRMVSVREFRTLNPDDGESRCLAKKIIAQSHALAGAGHRIPAEINKYLECVNNPEVVGDLMASVYIKNPILRQEILEEAFLPQRLELILITMRALPACEGE